MSDPQNPSDQNWKPADGSAPQPPAAPPVYTQPPAYSQPAPTYGSTQQGYPAAPPSAYGSSATGTVPGKTLGIVAFVLSFFTGLIALILGIVALVQSKKAGHSNGWALAAVIISAIGLIIGVIVFFALVLPSISAAATCASDPNAIVTIWGVQVSCTEVITDR